MRIVSIAAGAASMYCGSCLRDNALARELIRQGHDVTLLPLYTPLRTDEASVSDERVFFGGINVYLAQHIPLFRRAPGALRRLLDSPLALKVASRRSVSIDPRSLGELTLSILRGEDGHQRQEFRKLTGWLRTEPPPDVILLTNSLLIALARPLREALGCPVICTLQGEDLFLEGLSEPCRSRAIELIRDGATAADGFIAVSRYCAGHMANLLGIAESRLHVVPIGIDPEGFEGPRHDDERPFTIGFFARIAPEKGLHVACEIYRGLRARGLAPARLAAAGYMGGDQRGYLQTLERQMKAWGLGEEFRYHGSLDRAGKIDFLQGLDVLCAPSPYREPKGLYVLEAQAAGVPVVAPRHGAFPELLESTGGGVLAEPGDCDSFADAIFGLWRDRSRRLALGRAGHAGVREHFTLERMARRTVEVCETVRETCSNFSPARA